MSTPTPGYIRPQSARHAVEGALLLTEAVSATLEDTLRGDRFPRDVLDGCAASLLTAADILSSAAPAREGCDNG